MQFYKWLSNVFRNRLLKMEIWAILILTVILTNLENQLQRTSEFVPKALKQLFFVLIVFITPENMSCIHIKR